MTQRKMEFCSSSSFSKTKNNSIEQLELNPVTSMSTNRHEIVLKDKFKESDAEERIDVTCSTSAPSQKSQPEEKRSKGHQVLPKARKPQEQYFEGCLVMGRIACGYPLWPGMIRKLDSANGYTKFIRGRIRFCVQFFEETTTLRWLTSSMLRGFDAAKATRCRLRVATTPIVFVKFEKALRIAKAAANLPVEARLAKYTLKKAQQKHILTQKDGNLKLRKNLDKEKTKSVRVMSSGRK